MLLVYTKLGNSGKHGIGLFADQFIPKGTITWEYNPVFDSSFTKEEVDRMSDPSRKQFLHYAYLDKDLNKYVLCLDDQRFINHSAKIEDVNIQSTPTRDTAMRDIQLGEELLCDYKLFDDEYFDRVGVEESKLV